jgi:hypothetical protein
MNMRNFANHILAIAYENNLSVSNLKLQQVMYFALKTQRLKKLINEGVIGVSQLEIHIQEYLD